MLFNLFSKASSSNLWKHLKAKHAKTYNSLKDSTMNDDSSEPFHGWKECDVEHAIEMQKLLYKITGHSDGNIGQNTQKVSTNEICLLEQPGISDLSYKNTFQIY